MSSAWSEPGSFNPCPGHNRRYSMLSLAVVQRLWADIEINVSAVGIRRSDSIRAGIVTVPNARLTHARSGSESGVRNYCPSVTSTLFLAYPIN